MIYSDEKITIDTNQIVGVQFNDNNIVILFKQYALDVEYDDYKHASDAYSKISLELTRRDYDEEPLND